MQLKDYVWFFNKGFSAKFCNKIIFNSLKKKKIIGTTAAQKDKKTLSKEDIKNLKKIRNSNVIWTDEPWIYEELSSFIRIANINANWNFQYDYFESCQFTIYDKKQFYNWHQDSNIQPYISENINYNGKIRKLSCVCFLSDPKDYEGGELEIDLRNKENGKSNIIKFKLKKGGIVVFPSFVWHRVKPVTKGIRYSLVVWILGQPFK